MLNDATKSAWQSGVTEYLIDADLVEIRDWIE